jgi:DNA-3-methyladenine glycosylase
MFMLYGTSWAFNIVVGREGEPHAILVRALEPVEGLDLMAERRHLQSTSRTLTNGPGKLCQALALNRLHYGRDLCGHSLFLRDGWCGPIARSPRINIDYAGVWAARPWRFTERGNRYVSVPPR